MTITNKNRQSQSYLYTIGIGDGNKPYADWTDENTGIVTQGCNRQIPFDTYTTVNEGGKYYGLISDKLGTDVKFESHDS